MNALMTVQDLGFTYKGGNACSPVLANLSCTVNEGEILGLLGPNGSGKTTLLKILARLLSPTSGHVQLGGKSLSLYDKSELARRISFVPQDEDIFLPFSVEQVVLMGRAPYLGILGFEKKEDLQKVDEALKITGLQGLKHRSLQELSGGERQRVFLARSIAQETSLLILDEPTTHLDVRYQIEMLDLYTSLRQNRQMTLIMSLHDFHLAATYCDRLLLLNQGRVEAVGAPEQVLTRQRIEDVFSVSIHVGQDKETGQNYYLPMKKRS